MSGLVPPARLLRFVLCAILWTGYVQADTVDFLSNTRPQLSFLPYSAAERVRVAKNMLNLLAIYVNREAKINMYQSANPSIDPLPRATAIVANAANMTDQEFHFALSDIFLSQRDLHTAYFMPAPHSCYTFYQPLSFAVIDVPGSGPKAQPAQKSTVVVSGFSSVDGIMALSKPYLGTVAIGDTVLTIDGLGFGDWIQQNVWRLG
ncbi:hypothetical protein HDU91_002459, partial [Kappamyces sp. JEL0680]